LAATGPLNQKLDRRDYPCRAYSYSIFKGFPSQVHALPSRYVVQCISVSLFMIFQSCLITRPTLLRLFIIFQEVDGVLVEILPTVVVAHNGLWVFVLTHHLHLPVAVLQEIISSAKGSAATSAMQRPRRGSRRTSPDRLCSLR